MSDDAKQLIGYGLMGLVGLACLAWGGESGYFVVGLVVGYIFGGRGR